MSNVCVVLALCCAVLLAAPVAGADLLLNEILSSPSSDWDGDGLLSSRDDEWVEILNSGTAAVSLDGLFLRDGTGTAFHYGFTGSLAPGEVLLVYGSDAYAWQQANGAGSSGLSLNNSGDLVQLVRDTGNPDAADIIDSIQLPGHAASSERSMGRVEGGGPWVVFDALAPYGGSAEPQATGCAPSPGAQNVCDGIVPTQRIGVGRLKAKF